jgi:RimK family alpha-L-glutamate ligase
VQPGDVVLGRLDVRSTLDGVEPGLTALRRLEGRGVDVRNGPTALLAAHDKLTTALRLAAAAVPHPRTAHVGSDGELALEPPVVVKPRFGSWGKDVSVCRTRFGLQRCLRRLACREWFRRQGALVQELVEPEGHDVRLVVASGSVVGAIERVAAPGEWRTNIACGGERRAVAPSREACELAASAAAAIGGDLVGVDLLPDGRGGFVVLEVNGAVDFTEEYALDEQDVFECAVESLLRPRYAQLDAQEAEDEAPPAAVAWA